MAFLQGAAAHICMRAGLAVGGWAIPSEVSGEGLKQRLTAGISRNRASGTRGSNFPLALSPGYDYLVVSLSSGVRLKPP